MEWNVDPVLIRVGFLQIRYYGLIFALGIFGGYLLWKWQMLRQGYSEKQAEDFVLWGFLAVIVGSRLGHCLFYEPSFYLSHPWEMIAFWKGGLASHGAAIALVLTLYIYHRVQKIPLAVVCDCFSLSVAVGATAVRIGNFFNSEIVGRASDVPWAMKFPLYDKQMGYSQAILRHPSQLYEVTLGIFVFAVLYFTDRHYGKDRPTGILGALLLASYFTGRFIVEFFKEFQVPIQDQIWPNFPLTMGQLLSIPFALVGYYWLYRILRKKKEVNLSLQS